MYCPNCGKEVMEGDVFCANCGYRLQAEAPVVTPIEEDNSPMVEDGLLDDAASQNAESQNVELEQDDPFISDEDVLKVPVKDVHGDGPAMICRMCGCRIPANSVYCPVCNQQTGYVPPRPQATQYYYAPPYQSQAQYQAQPRPKKNINVFALVGFILSMASLFITAELGLGLSIAGLVLGCLGLKKSKQTGKGRKFAVAAMVLGIIGIVLNVLLIVLQLTGVLAGLEAWLYEWLGMSESGETIYPIGDGFWSQLY